jgi:diacylglycerol kinase (ATP)
MKPSIRFIINPVAGHQKGRAIGDLIANHPALSGFETDIKFTEKRHHATELAARSAGEGFEIVVAVGGDGTVNETARGLLGTSTCLGIVPAGSGNGLARHLQYSKDPGRCLEIIARKHKIRIDTLMVNGEPSWNVSGFGFDGYVAWLFDKSDRKGLAGYTKIALKEYGRYQPVDFSISMDHIQFEGKAHMIVFANASQFGNAATIAPKADLSDGKMDVIIVKKPPLYRLPFLFYRLFTGTLRNDAYTSMYQCNTLIIKSKDSAHLHIDGEPRTGLQEVRCSIQHLSLNVISNER